MENEFYISPSKVWSLLVERYNYRFRIAHTSWKNSRALFIFQCFAIGGALYLAYSLIPVLSEKVPMLQNIQFIPEPFNWLSYLIILIFLKNCASLVSDIKLTEFFRMNWKLTFFVVIVELLIAVSIGLAFKFKQSIKGYFLYFYGK